ncbi:MAG: hypothetical protein Q4E67_02520 [Planctomycetia bacterium]|nr:hypothetical protein [Planctomycetia bacterium]
MPSGLPSELERLLSSLRRRIRGYVVGESLALLTIHWGILFWISLILDRFWEPDVWIRGLFWLGAGIGLVWDVWWTLIQPLRVPLDDHTLGLLLEKQFPELNDTLLTVLEPQNLEEPQWQEVLLAKTREDLRKVLPTIRPGRMFRWKPLGRSLLGGCLMVASVGGFAWLYPESMAVWQNRMLALSQERWPRTFVLTAEGFQEGRVKVARGSDWELRLSVRLAEGVPAEKWESLRTVYLYYRTVEGGRNQVAMIREGERHSSEAEVEFSYTFRSVLSSMTLDIYALDTNLRNLQVEVVESPAVADMTLALEFPAYMARGGQTVPVSGVMSIPEGTAVTIQARTNKPLEEVRIVRESGAAVVLPGEQKEAFQWRLEGFSQDETLAFHLKDTDGLDSRKPVRLALANVEDQLPTVDVTPVGIGTAVTPQARIPVKGKITDDYGLAKTFFDYRVERLSEDQTGEKAHYQTIAEYEGNPTEIRFRGEKPEVLELESLGLREKDRLQLTVVAEDRCTLAEGRHVGISPPVTLEVVSPQRLRLLVEAREIVLRQLFEAIRQEVLDSRDSLREIRWIPGESAETESKSEGETEESSRGLQSYRVERVIQNNRKNAHELYGIVEGIENCMGQIVNNRIDTPAWLERLEEGIRKPLENVSREAFPELEKRLFQFQKWLGGEDATQAEVAHAEVLREMDAILSSLDAVLEKMTQMQDFHEVAEMLRQVIRSQEELNEKVRQEQRAALLDLE